MAQRVYEAIAHCTVPGNFSITPLLPFLVLEQRERSLALVSIAAPQPVRCVSARSVQQCLTLSAPVHDDFNRFLACLRRGLDPVKAISKPMVRAIKIHLDR